MTADQAIDLARFMRPGVVFKVGALEAVDVAEPSADEQPIWRKNALGIKPAHAYPLWQSSWCLHDLYHSGAIDHLPLKAWLAGKAGA